MSARIALVAMIAMVVASCAGPSGSAQVVTVSPSAHPGTTPRASVTERPVLTAQPTPTPTPTVGITATVPSSIDATCSEGVGPALNAWIAALPDGSTLVFPSGSCYLFNGDQGIYLAGRSYLTLVGTGSTLRMYTTGAGNDASAFFFQDASHVTIRGFAVDGGNPATGTAAAWDHLDEHHNGAVIRAGSSFIEFDHVAWDRGEGFGVFVGADGGAAWPTGISVHDSYIRGYECGLCVVAGNNITFSNNTVNDSMGSFVDFEPDASQPEGGGFRNVLISGNRVNGFGWVQTGTSWFVGSVPQDPVIGTAVMNGLTVTGNRVDRGAVGPKNGNYTGLGGLGIRADKANVKNDYVITNNWTATANTGPGCVMYLTNVHNLTVTGNTQPIDNGGSLVCDSGTTGTRTVSGNITAP